MIQLRPTLMVIVVILISTAYSQSQTELLPKIISLAQKCPADRLKILDNGETGCIPKVVLSSSTNCFKFGYKKETTTEFECAACDQSSSAKFLVELKGGYKGCAQIRIPQVKLYKPSTTKDAGQNFIMIPAVCNDGITLNNQQRLAVPSLSVSPNDLAGGICRSSYANIDIWQVQSQQYVFGRCEAQKSPKFTKQVALISTAKTTSGCIYSGTDKAYDINCVKYSYQKSTFNCSECQKSADPTKNFGQVNVESGKAVYVKCLATSNIKYDAQCDLYSQNQWTCKKCQGTRTIVTIRSNTQSYPRCIGNSPTDYNFDSKCLFYNTSFACLSCNNQAGFTLVKMQVQVEGQMKTFMRCMLESSAKYSQGCEVYDDKFKCAKCKFSQVKVLVESKIASKCFPSNRADEFCAVYNTAFNCISCVEGYVISFGSRCIKKSNVPSGLPFLPFVIPEPRIPGFVASDVPLFGTQGGVINIRTDRG